MSAEQLATDLAGRTRYEANRYALGLMVYHLRNEHGWGIRRIGRTFGLTDSEVRQLLDGEA